MYFRSNRTYLEVEYKEKNKVKALGAMWDPGLKRWFAPPGTDLSPLALWLPLEYLSKIEVTKVDFSASAEELRGQCNLCGGKGQNRHHRLCSECKGAGRVRNDELPKHPTRSLSTNLGAVFPTAEDSKAAKQNWRLRAALSNLRWKLARDHGERPFAVFDDTVLERIVLERPTSEFALHGVNGMSAARVKKFGNRIVACVLGVLSPDESPPPRPIFAPCTFCNELQVLTKTPGPGFRCRKCARSTDPRTVRRNLTVKLPTANDFD